MTGLSDIPSRDFGASDANTYPAHPVSRRAEPLSLPTRQQRRRLRPGMGSLAATDVVVQLAAGLFAGLPAGQTLVFAMAGTCLFLTGGLYRLRLTLSTLSDVPVIVIRALAAGAFAAAFGLVVGKDAMAEQCVRAALVLSCLAVLVRSAVYGVARYQRRHGRVRRALVLGAGRVGGRLLRHLGDHCEYGLLPVAVLDPDPLLSSTDIGVPVLGREWTLASAVRAYDAQVVLVAFTSMSGAEMVDVIQTCDRQKCTIFSVPRLFELQGIRQHTDDVWGLPLVRQTRPLQQRPGWRVKRLIDVVLAGALLAVVAPVIGILAVLLRWEGGPGVIFRQVRVGRDGRLFTLLKLRSMRPANDIESQTCWNIADDARVGPVGRFARRTSLDELPQFWNVIRGEMSLVGPRPERSHFVNRFERTNPRYSARHRVPCGLTGWAQIHNLRGDTSIEDRVRFDNYYIENWSLWLDVRILLRTVVAVFSSAAH